MKQLIRLFTILTLFSVSPQVWGQLSSGVQEGDFVYSLQGEELRLSFKSYAPEVIEPLSSLDPAAKKLFFNKRQQILNKTADSLVRKLRFTDSGIKYGSRKVVEWEPAHRPSEELRLRLTLHAIEVLLREIDTETLRSAKVIVRRNQIGFVIGGGLSGLIGLPNIWFKGRALSSAFIFIFDTDTRRFSSHWVFDKERIKTLYASIGIELNANFILGAFKGNDYLKTDKPHRVSRDTVSMVVREVSEYHRGLYWLGALTFPPPPLSSISAYTFETRRTKMSIENIKRAMRPFLLKYFNHNTRMSCRKLF